MHFAQTRNCRERMRGDSSANARAGTCLPESLSSHRFQLDEGSSHTPAIPCPLARQHLLQPGRASSPSWGTHLSWLTLSLAEFARLGQIGRMHLSFSSSLLPCPALPSRAGGAALLLLFSHPAGCWPAQWEGEELKAAVLSSGLVTSHCSVSKTFTLVLGWWYTLRCPAWWRPMFLGESLRTTIKAVRAFALSAS